MQKNGEKRWDIHWVHWFFWCKKWLTKKGKNQQSNIPCDLRKVCYFLTINQKCSLAIEVKKTCKKLRERTGFKWVVAAVMKAGKHFTRNNNQTCTLCLDKRLRSSLQPVMNTEWKEDRKKKQERKKNRNMWALDFLQHLAHTYLLMVGFKHDVQGCFFWN